MAIQFDEEFLPRLNARASDASFNLEEASLEWPDAAAASEEFRRALLLGTQLQCNDGLHRSINANDKHMTIRNARFIEPIDTEDKSFTIEGDVAKTPPRAVFYGYLVEVRTLPIGSDRSERICIARCERATKSLVKLRGVPDECDEKLNRHVESFGIGIIPLHRIQYAFDDLEVFAEFEKISGNECAVLPCLLQPSQFPNEAASFRTDILGEGEHLAPPQFNDEQIDAIGRVAKLADAACGIEVIQGPVSSFLILPQNTIFNYPPVPL
mmetsp:Transcript_72133/g.204852  ORF Transcript_72133/g.204852 Transcript_72133/m.204852 type:complete len:268 (+) Transcript_72133:58-861(+)